MTFSPASSPRKSFTRFPWGLAVCASPARRGDDDLNRARLARVPRRQPDARRSRRAVDAAHVPGRRRLCVAEPPDHRRSCQVLRPDRPGRAQGRPWPGFDRVDGTPRPVRLAVAADEQLVQVPRAGRSRFPEPLHYRQTLPRTRKERFSGLFCCRPRGQWAVVGK